MNKTVLVVVGLIVIVGGLLALGSFMGRDGAKMWKDTSISCLVNGHTNLQQHIHPTLSILVDGVPETVPANIGLTPDCMAEIHTHDATGKVHIETIHPKTFTFGDFFLVQGTTLERAGYTVEVFSDSVLVLDPLTLPLSDHQNIEVRYTKAQ